MDSNQPANSAPVPPNSGNNTKVSWFSQNKKLVIIGSTVGGLLLLASIAVIIYVALFSISKKDYAELNATVRDVRTSYSTANIRFSTYTSSLTYGFSSSSVSNFEDAYDEYKENVAKLEGLKALRDGEVKEKYDVFIEQNKKFTSFVDEFVAIGDDIKQVNEDCAASKASGITSATPDNLLDEYDEVANTCKDSLEKLKDSKIDVVVDYADDMIGLYDEQRGYFEEYVDAYKANDRTKGLEVRSKITRQASEFTSTARDFRTALTDAADEAEVKDELNDFIEVVNDKSRG